MTTDPDVEYLKRIGRGSGGKGIVESQAAPVPLSSASGVASAQPTIDGATTEDGPRKLLVTLADRVEQLENRVRLMQRGALFLVATVVLIARIEVNGVAAGFWATLFSLLWAVLLLRQSSVSHDGLTQVLAGGTEAMKLGARFSDSVDTMSTSHTDQRQSNAAHASDNGQLTSKDLPASASEKSKTVSFDKDANSLSVTGATGAADSMDHGCDSTVRCPSLVNTIGRPVELPVNLPAKFGTLLADWMPGYTLFDNQCTTCH